MAAARPGAIRDAASLILVRDPDTDPRVLLGRRAASNRFMPGMYVFPGGVLHREDFRARAAGELHATCAALMGVRRSADKAAALAKTAVRETLEETGLMLGEPGEVGAPDDPIAPQVPQAPQAPQDPQDLSDPGWRAIQAAGLRPRLTALTYLGRAITPVSMPLRFNARFFMAAESETRGALADSEELDDLQWIRPAAWATLPMVDITVYILKRFEQIRQRANRGQAFVFRHHRGRAEVRWQDDTPRPPPVPPARDAR